ncbi:hypothetical protein V5G94_25195, partial [Citrobacter braakii]
MWAAVCRHVWKHWGSARPPGEGQNAPSAAGEQPLSTQQRTVLERLITRLISLTQQQ